MVTTSCNELKDYKVYNGLPNEERNEEYQSLINSWHNFLAQNVPDLQENTDYYIHQRNLYEVVQRVHKRKVYYKVFHNLEKINELKQVALECYWINTLKPFMVVNENCGVYNAPNEMFSVYLIISTIRKLFIEVFPEKTFQYPSSKRIADMIYNFKYCDLSREATIAFVETFADAYGVGIQFILDKTDHKEQ